MNARLQAYQEGLAAYRNGVGVDGNPYAPAPPGPVTLCRLWLAGWRAGRREASR